VFVSNTFLNCTYISLFLSLCVYVYYSVSLPYFSLSVYLSLCLSLFPLHSRLLCINLVQQLIHFVLSITAHSSLDLFRPRIDVLASLSGIFRDSFGIFCLHVLPFTSIACTCYPKLLFTFLLRFHFVISFFPASFVQVTCST